MCLHLKKDVFKHWLTPVTCRLCIYFVCFVKCYLYATVYVNLALKMSTAFCAVKDNYDNSDSHHLFLYFKHFFNTSPSLSLVPSAKVYSDIRRCMLDVWNWKCIHKEVLFSASVCTHSVPTNGCNSISVIYSFALQSYMFILKCLIALCEYMHVCYTSQNIHFGEMVLRHRTLFINRWVVSRLMCIFVQQLYVICFCIVQNWC